MEKYKVGDKIKWTSGDGACFNDGDIGRVTVVADNYVSLFNETQDKYTGAWGVPNENWERITEEPATEENTEGESKMLKIGDKLRWVGLDGTYFNRGDIGEVRSISEGITLEIYNTTKGTSTHGDWDGRESWELVSKQTTEETAKRYNAGKVDLSLIPVEATIQECRVWELGEKKYGRENWKKLWGDDTVNVVMASAMRHMMAILDGQKDDPETGVAHAAHVRCNMAMLLEYYKQHEEKERK